MRRWQSILILVAMVASPSLAGCANPPADPAPQGENLPDGLSTDGEPPLAEHEPSPKKPPLAENEPNPEKPTIAEQARRLAVRLAFRAGQTLYNQGQFRKALNRFDEVLRLEPGQEEAITLRNACRVRLGLAKAEITPDREVSNLSAIAVQRDLHEAKQLMTRATFAFTRGEYEKAASLSTKAVTLYKGLPSRTDVTDRLEAATALAADATTRHKTKKRTGKAASLKDQAGLISKRANQLKKQRLATIDGVVKRTWEELGHGNYAGAREIVRDAEQAYPTSERISHLAETVHKRAVEAEGREIELTKVAEWGVMFTRIKEASIPHHEVIKFPTAAKWRKITEKRRSLQKQNKLTLSSKPEDAELRAKLERTVLPDTRKYDDTLEAHIAELASFYGFSVIVSESAYAGSESGEDSKNFNIGNKANRELPAGKSLASALKTLLDDQKLDYTIEDGIVRIGRKDEVGMRVQRRIYPISDLLVKTPDFHGPDLAFAKPKNNREEDPDNPDNKDNDDPEDEDLLDDDVDVFGEDDPLTKKEGESSDLQQIDSLVRIIKRTIAPNTWNEDSNGVFEHDEPGYIVGDRGALSVTHTEQVHQKIADLLSDLRDAKNIMVTIEARFLKVNQSFVENISGQLTGTRTLDSQGRAATSGTPVVVPGLLLRSNDFNDSRTDSVTLSSTNILQGDIATRLASSVLGTGLNLAYSFLDDEMFNFVVQAARQRSRSSVLSAPRITVFNNQRAFIAITKTRSFIERTEVVSTGSIGNNGGTSSTDPVPGKLTEGIVLEVRPTVLHNRKFVRIEVRATNSLGDLSKSVVLVTRIRQETSNATGTATVEGEQASVTLPVVQNSTIRTTVVVPDHGTILLGGLAEMKNSEGTTSVPLFSDLPLFGFLFTQRAKVDERSNLILLLRAEISIIEDMELEQTGVSRRSE